MRRPTPCNVIGQARPVFRLSLLTIIPSYTIVYRVVNLVCLKVFMIYMSHAVLENVILHMNFLLLMSKQRWGI